MLYDVVICGAGPAGSFAARLLAAQGLAVALLDKARFPREKPCGGALSRKALALLDLDVEPVIERRVTGAWLAHGGRAVRHDTGALVAAMTRRTAFDALLLDAATARGARFHPECPFEGLEAREDRLRITAGGRTFEGRWLLAADGAASAVRGALLGRALIDYAPALEALIEVPPGVLDRFAERVLLEVGAVAGGYGWIFGKRDHLNVGVYSTRGGAGIRAGLHAFLARQPALGRGSAVRYLGYPIPIGNRAGVFEHGRVWLLGDAAGLAEPVLGEGIYFALESARLAARAFAAARGAPPVGAYSRLVQRELVPELGAAARLARACYRRPRFTFDHVARNPRAAALFLGLVTGEVGYRECVVKALARLPGWLAARRVPALPLAALS